MASKKKAGNKKLRASKKLQHTKPLAVDYFVKIGDVRGGS
jgi:hypothetical protein